MRELSGRPRPRRAVPPPPAPPPPLALRLWGGLAGAAATAAAASSGHFAEERRGGGAAEETQGEERRAGGGGDRAGTGFPRSRGSRGAKGSPGRGTGEPRLPRGAPLPAPCTMSWGTELWVSEGLGPPGCGGRCLARLGWGRGPGCPGGGDRALVGVPAAWG